MEPWTDRIALITGASRGIGLAIADALARQGASVVVAARTEQQLKAAAAELQKKHSCEILAVACDISDERAVEDLFARTADRFGRLDLLVNNAGAFDGGPLEELTTEAWDRVMATNLRGPFLCTRAAMRMMKPRGRGRIINIGSISAQRVRPNSAAYSASKFGLWGLTQVTALEGRDHGVTCCCLHPGNTLVPRREASQQTEDQEPMMSCEDLARVVLTMATLPDDVCMLEAIVLPRDQLYVGRG